MKNSFEIKIHVYTFTAGSVEQTGGTEEYETVAVIRPEAEGSGGTLAVSPESLNKQEEHFVTSKQGVKKKKTRSPSRGLGAGRAHETLTPPG